MKVTLTVDGGKHSGQEIAIAVSEVKIGREEKCNIVIDSEDVSRLHCSLSVKNDEVVLRDEKSSNGTYVNKRRLRGELQLEDGDSIQVGPQLFTISIENEPAVQAGNGQADLLKSLPMADESDDEMASKTLIGRIPVIDPGELEDAENKRLRDRLKGL